MNFSIIYITRLNPQISLVIISTTKEHFQKYYHKTAVVTQSYYCSISSNVCCSRGQHNMLSFICLYGVKEQLPRDFALSFFSVWLKGRSLSVGETITGKNQVLYPPPFLAWADNDGGFFISQMKRRIWVLLRVYFTHRLNSNELHFNVAVRVFTAT